MNSELAYLSQAMNQADAAPTDAMHAAYHDYCQDLTKLSQQWSDLMKQDLPAVNAQLSQQHLQPLPETMLMEPCRRAVSENGANAAGCLCMAMLRNSLVSFDFELASLSVIACEGYNRNANK